MSDYLHRKANCAGQECEDRDACLRYVERRSWEKDVNGHARYAWASFDIERMVYGDCKHFIRVREPANG